MESTPHLNSYWAQIMWYSLIALQNLPTQSRRSLFTTRGGSRIVDTAVSRNLTNMCSCWNNNKCDSLQHLCEKVKSVKTICICCLKYVNIFIEFHEYDLFYVIKNQYLGSAVVVVVVGSSPSLPPNMFPTPKSLPDPKSKRTGKRLGK